MEERELEKVKITLCCCECGCEELFDIDGDYICSECGTGQCYGDLESNSEVLGKKIIKVCYEEE